MKNPHPFIQENSGTRLVSCTRPQSSYKWRVEHSFDTDRILVMLLDDDLNDIYPGNVYTNGSNEVIADMNGETSGYMTVIKMTPILKGSLIPVNNVVSHICTHRLGSFLLLVQCWDSNGYLVNPKNITFYDDENANIEFEEPFTGYIKIVRPVPESFSVTDARASWEDRYNSNIYQQLIMSSPSDGYEIFFPKVLQRLDKKILATLHQSETGDLNSIIHGYRT